MHLISVSIVTGTLGLRRKLARTLYNVKFGTGGGCWSAPLYELLVKRDSSDSDIVYAAELILLLSNLVILGGWPIEYNDDVDMSEPIRP